VLSCNSASLRVDEVNSLRRNGRRRHSVASVSVVGFRRTRLEDRTLTVSHWKLCMRVIVVKVDIAEIPELTVDTISTRLPAVSMTNQCGR